MLRMTEQEQQEIRHIAECIYPYECCGFLIGNSEDGMKRVERVEVAENQRYDSPANRFLITPEQFRKIENDLRDNGGEILGFFHSHPDVEARPSSYDLNHAWPWYSYVIVSVRDGSSVGFTSWQLEDDRSSFRQEQIHCSS